LPEREREAHIPTGIGSRCTQTPEKTYDAPDAPKVFYDPEHQTARFAKQRFFRLEKQEVAVTQSRAARARGLKLREDRSRTCVTGRAPRARVD
jgi:hypothetical protein